MAARTAACCNLNQLVLAANADFDAGCNVHLRCAMVHAVGARSGCVEAARGWSLRGSAPVMAIAWLPRSKTVRDP